MTPTQLAALHARCFTTPRPYKASEFETTLRGTGVFLITRPNAFLMGRVIVDEVELLTLAVDPDHRRQGIAANMLGEFIGTSDRLGARTAFLDVAANNPAAQTLYETFGFVETDRRRDYYRKPDGSRLDAILMMRDL